MRNPKLVCVGVWLLQAYLSATIWAAEKPNVVIILVDDLGYGDVNFAIDGIPEFANPEIKTPNLSGLASESVVFRHHYAAAPVCSPSRAGLLTGRTPTRCNIDLYINDISDNDQRFLAGPELTIAEIAKTAGYSTAVFGKWHLNGADWEQVESWTGWTGSFPKQQGFDHGWVSKENPHFTRALQVNTQKHPGDFFAVDGRPLGTMKGYTSDLIADAAIEWLTTGRDSTQPFLLYLPFDAVHIRISSADEFETAYDTGDPNRDIYYANISHLDSAIGRLLRAMEALHLSKDTLVIFSSDNGPDVLNKWPGTSMCMGTAHPLYGGKYQLHEGGIRVPGMIRWPATFRPRVSDEPNSTLDILPTLCEIFEEPVPQDREIDGVSLLSNLTDGIPVERDKPLYWQFEYPLEYDSKGTGYQQQLDGSSRRKAAPAASVMVRRGDYILRGLQRNKYELPEEFRLFNIVDDPRAIQELSNQQPAEFARLKAELTQMHASVARDRIATLGFIETHGKSAVGGSPSSDARLDNQDDLKQSGGKNVHPQIAVPQGTVGYFRLSRVGSRACLLTPDDQPYLALGVNHIAALASDTELFQAQFSRSWDSFQKTLDSQFNAWHMNCVGYGAPVELQSHYPYFATIQLAFIEKHRSNRRAGSKESFHFPDVFDSVWKQEVAERIKQLCDIHRENKNCIGYLWTDTPTWDLIKTRGLRGTDWVSAIRDLPPTAPGKLRYADFLAQRYQDKLADFNVCYDLELSDFSELSTADLTQVAVGRHVVQRDDEEFLRLIAREFYSTVGAAQRKYDPNHLVFGDRYLVGDHPHVVLEEATPWIDAVAIQPGDRYAPYYPPSTIYPSQEIRDIRDVTGKPILICDHAISFPTSHYPHTIFEQMPSEQEAVLATEKFVAEALSEPFILGFLRCQYVDRPATFGRGLRQGLLDHQFQPRSTLIAVYARQFSQAMLRVNP